MNIGTETQTKKINGFTLIEILVVIAIIAVIASLVVYMAGQATDKAKRSRVEAMKAQIIAAIEAYHARHGFYPPDNPMDPAVNQLFYELTGTVYKDNKFYDIEGREADPTVFNAGGFVHSAQPPDKPQNFLQSASAKIESRKVTDKAYVLAVPFDWPSGRTNIIPSAAGVNPWRYVSTKPVHNVNSYDLWAEIVIGDRVVLISNWQK
ncbi:MAG: prepilin-type N-terminal cleavage/methylation domain-containing protein [Verrucomicrobiae bacterium]|nr:prepilin-type N-terminal cleavage/methylation domain-containing protein [Verrucomicrobiae bacterium]